ncbi:MAG: phosphate acetyltransferase, partial [Terrimesophilobacter sp.]
MARSIYITSAEGNTGKSTVALGVLDTLIRSIERVGVFRPVSRSSTHRDYVLELLLDHDGVDLDYDLCVGVSYEDVHADPDAALATIVQRFKAVEELCDAVVIVGSDYTDVGSPTELGFNARIAANLGAPVVLVLGGRVGERPEARSADALRQLAEVSTVELRHEHATLLAVIANRADPAAQADIRAAIGSAVPDVPVWTIPENPVLVAPTMRSIMEATDGTLLKGDPELLNREALGVVVAAMGMNNVLPRLIEGSVVVVPADRTEVLLAVLMANESGTFPSVAGIVLNGGFELPEPIDRLIEGLRSTLPVIRTELGSYDTAVRITQIRPRLAADSQRKLDTARAMFEQSVDATELLGLLDVERTPVVTPLMFEYGLVERARSNRRHIVLPEGGDDRILRASATVLSRGIADITILGEEIEVRSRAIGLGLDIQKATVLSSFDDVLRLKFSEEYLRLRAHKGVTIERARDTVTDPSYFGTLMVQLGLADGMVSGAAHTTAHTVRPAFEIIKTRKGVSVVSSVFLMALADRVLVYGDCAVIPDPTAPQLADIAVSATATARQFGIEPRIAMLSYSTG